MRFSVVFTYLGIFFGGAPLLAQAEPKSGEPLAVEPKPEPFAFADFTWVPGNGRNHETPLQFEYFTGEFRIDTTYNYSFSRPKDDTISGSSEAFRHGEFQLTQLGIGGDFHYGNVHGRVMTQFGVYSQATPRNDTTPARGQWRLDDAYRYLSEAYGGYHLDILSGINLQAGIFVSYVGLWSYYQADNWTYQPSYVSSNTPWYFNGVRAQIFVNEHLKLEPWIVNGWQSYGRFNSAPGVGNQVLWRPNGWLSVLANVYAGKDTLGVANRRRFHSDNSVVVKFYDSPGSLVSKGAFSFTVDVGCEDGGGVTCHDQYFAGFMSYMRWWFLADMLSMTVGGGAVSNPGRYLAILPPVNGATAFSGTPYFTTAPHDSFKAWDVQATVDIVPQEQATFRIEYNHRQANVPYFSGHDGVTPPGGNQGAPGSLVEGWAPDLARAENRITLALLVKI